MKNVWISFILFIIMIVAIFLSLNYLNSSCSAMGKKNDRLEQLVSEEKWKESYELSKELLSEWKDHSKIIIAFINHLEVETINNELLKLTQYSKEKNKEESLASIHVVKFYLENIKELQKINVQNIF